MSWGEAIRLTDILLADPSSMLAADNAKWEYPISREAMVLMDVFDLDHAVNSKDKPKPYPRPWKTVEQKRHGKTDMSREQVLEVLRRFGHTI